MDYMCLVLSEHCGSSLANLCRFIQLLRTVVKVGKYGKWYVFH